MAASIRQHEVIRGKILYYLALLYPKAVPLPLLQGELDIFGFPLPMEDLQFHLAYLAEKGFVALENVRGPRAHRQVSLVKITAKGIDYYDGRLPAEEGVYLEPRGEK